MLSRVIDHDAARVPAVFVVNEGARGDAMSRRRVLDVHQEGSEEQARAARAQPVAKPVACAHLDQIRNARDGLVHISQLAAQRVQVGPGSVELLS